jgi:ATP-dependent protease ClpP protease subunit
MAAIHKIPAGKGATKPSGYRMAAKGAKGEIYLYGVIGQTFFSDGVSATQFKDDLKALGPVTSLDVRINSEGGDVFEGRTMYSLLAEHKASKTVYVDGLAASAASLIAMAGDEIRMGDGTFMMIHNPWGMSVGDANEMRRTADLLDSVGKTLVDTYAARTKNTPADVKQWMDAETWMSAQEAVDKGFADSVTEPVRVAAAIRRPQAFKHLPAALQPNRIAANAAAARIAALTTRT